MPALAAIAPVEVLRRFGFRRTFNLSVRAIGGRFGLVRRPKVFAIGFNKSGTTSLHTLFESLGLLSYHGARWRDCDNLYLLNAFDCFSDNIPQDLLKIDRLFPGSKFILQVRELDTWVYSRLAHIERAKKQGVHEGGPYWDDSEITVEHWIRQRNDHHVNVLEYFSRRPSDLLVVNFIRDAAAASKVACFLGHERHIERPSENINPAGSVSKRHIQRLHACADRLGLDEAERHYDLLCPSLLDETTRARWAPDTSLIPESGRLDV